MKTKHLQIGRAGRYMLLLLMLPLMAAKAYAYDFSAVCSTGQTLYYNITDNGNHLVELTCPGTNNNPYPWNYTMPEGNITIPSTVTYNDVAYTVAAIGDYAFYYCNGLTGSLIIPDSVTEIGEYAFYRCWSLTGTLTIGNSVTEIGDYAFDDCFGFTGSLTIPDSVTEIGEYAFANCDGFWGTLTIGNSVTEIGDYAFSGCSGFMGTLTIGNSVTEIGDHAFSGCSAFAGSLTIPDSVTEIGDYAFANCSGFMGSLTIGNSVTEIGDYAFYYCDGFAGSLTIGNSVTEIGDNAFYYCDGFTGSLTIPDSVTEIGDNAFTFCSGFTGSLTIPNSVTEIGDYAFYNCYGFTGSLTIGNSVTYIGEGAFYSCSGFTGSLTIGNSVTSIGRAAFAYCHGLTGSLTISDSVTEIGEGAFYNCYGFTGSLTIGNSVTSIGDIAFEYCYGLTGSLTIPDSVTEIGAEAFYHCSGFADSLIIGNSVALIRYYAFAGCTNLQSLQVEALNPPIIGNNTFEELDKTIPVTVPCGSLSAYQTAPYWSDFTNIQEDFFFTLSVSSANDDMGSATITQQPDCTNDVAIVTATPNPGFIFVNWTKNGEVVSTEAIYTFSLTENTALVANFDTDLNSSIISAFANPEAGGMISGAGVYNNGTDATLSATANEGYTFVNWMENDVEVSTSPSYTFTVSADRTLVANFSLNSYTISVSANLEAGGTVSGGGEYHYGADATLSATANEGYTFVNWTENDVEVSTSPSYTFTVSADRTLVANFSQVTGVEENDAARLANFAYISNGELVISCEGKKTLHIFDMMGRVLSSQTINGDCRISANRMTAGTYILNLNGMAQKIVVK